MRKFIRQVVLTVFNLFSPIRYDRKRREGRSFDSHKQPSQKSSSFPACVVASLYVYFTNRYPALQKYAETVLPTKVG
jgi:hypothetical protein